MPDESHNSLPKGDTSYDAQSANEDDDALLAEARDALKTQIDSDTGSGVQGKLPKRIGRYRIISVLGQGGMGTVFEAEQEHPKRAVALKVVRGGQYVDEHYVRLFQREAQTLARLKHPGIATIYEAGCTEDGQHFFAMELVRGVLLNRYVENKKLRLRPRLRLFRRICDAINYAHQRGVIHRDLKPSNILIDEEGRPKILDFGLARITEVDIAAATIVTEVGKIQGTLAYMSPEQARGNPDEIDLRSDVYTLGVILFELLTGSLPYEVEHSVLHESVRAICEDNPRRPGTIDASLRGDVETIILKALEKEPARRYHSAAALSEDIERYLTSQPILAQRPSTMYQLRKLVARHKAAFSFVAVLFVVITAFGISMRVALVTAEAERKNALELLQRAQDAEQDAQEQAQTAEEVKDFLIDLFRVSDPYIAALETPSLRELLDKGAAKVSNDLKDQPKVRSALMDTLGMVYRNLALYDEAARLLKKALETRQKYYQDKANPELAESLHNYGGQLRLTGNYEEAEDYVRAGLAMRRVLLDRALPGVSEADVAESQLILGAVHRYQGEYKEAEDLVRKALFIQEQRLENCTEDQERKDIKKEIARHLETLAEILEENGDYDEAIEHAKKALKIREDIEELGPEHADTASTKYVLALLYRDRGEYDEAERCAKEARGIYLHGKGKLQEEHVHVIQVTSALGSFLRDQGRIPEAEQLLRDAFDHCGDHVRKDHPHQPFTTTNLAWLLLDLGQDREAKALFREARTFYGARGGGTHPQTAEPLRGLAQIVLARGDAKAAERLLREALSIYDAALGSEHWSTAITNSVLLECLTAQGKYEEAEKLVSQSYKIMKDIRGEEDRYVKEARTRVHNLYIAWGKADKAAEYGPRIPNP